MYCGPQVSLFGNREEQGLGFWGGFSLFVSLHKLFGKSIFFSRKNLCHLRNYDFDDSLDIDTLLRMYFPFNECFDVLSVFSVFHVCIFHDNSFAVIYEIKDCNSALFLPKGSCSFLTESVQPLCLEESAFKWSLLYIFIFSAYFFFGALNCYCVFSTEMILHFHESL